MKVTIVGAGIFGISSAAALARRGHRVEVHEAGDRLPSERAASRDTSKVLRLEYGADSGLYAPRVAEALRRWRELEDQTSTRLVHRTGYLALTTDGSPAGFEATSHAWLVENGFASRVLERDELARSFPVLDTSAVAFATLSPDAGWLDPPRCVEALARVARGAGAEIRLGSRVEALDALEADAVLVAAGAWTPRLVPEGLDPLAVTRQHESFFRPGEPDRWADLPVWSYDVTTEGWYGLPLHPDGTLKIACHDPSRPADPEVDRAADPAEAGRIRAFTGRVLPGLDGCAETGRTCLYTMTDDGRFRIDAVPGRGGVFVATGGSGHGFKFGPLLGEWAADVVEGKPGRPEFRLGRR